MTRHHALLTRDMTASGSTIAIKLQGKHGKGRTMVLDELDWSRVRRVVGEVWNVSRVEGREYVMTNVGKNPLNPLKGKKITLARWLTWAEPGEVVSYRDGDALNLTRANLMTMGRGEFLRGFWDSQASIFSDHNTVLPASKRNARSFASANGTSSRPLACAIAAALSTASKLNDLTGT